MSFLNRKSKTKNCLPEEFKFSHDYCLYLHDYLVNFIVEGEKNKVFKTTFKFKSKNEAIEFKNNPDIFIMDWLEEKGYSDILGEVLIKAIFPALLSDFCHFIFEALSCSRKGKLAVAFALLRKPLKENLHYLEWLLADPEDLLNTFYNQPSEEISFKKILDQSKIKSKIQKAISKTFDNKAIDADFLYNLRFNKETHYGFERLWNKALHLITTKKSLETEQANFNFIFSSKGDYLIQWQHLYRNLPYILFYTTQICDTLMSLISKEIPHGIEKIIFHRSIGFILWGHSYLKYFGKSESDYKIMVDLMILECPKCIKKIKLNDMILSRLFFEHKLQCPNCLRQIKLPDFIETNW